MLRDSLLSGVPFVRNLIGRLNARTPGELGRIANAWHVPLGSADKSGQVGQIYRALTDPRAVRDAWSELSESDRALITTLARSPSSLTIAEIGDKLDRDAADLRENAAELYRSGWIGREGDDGPLPVGESPRLFVPRELAHIVRRVEEEIRTGDLSSRPLSSLLTLLDDVEIEETAQIWGIRVVPGLRSRNELIDSILKVAGDADRHRRVTSALKRQAAAIYERLRAEPEPISIDTAAEAAELDRASPIDGQRFREALSQLERSLFAWHTYHSDGSRWLFLPPELRAPQPRPEAPRPPVVTVDDVTPIRPYRHEVAWDLLTLLRALAEPDRPRPRFGDPFPTPWLRRFNTRLWHRGPNEPPPGYVPFLVSIAVAEGLLAPEDGRTGTPVVTNEHRRWRDRSFDDQDAHLRWRWLTATTWIEGTEQVAAHVWGGDWRALRRGLLSTLSALEVGAWYSIEAVADWIAQRESTLLGSTFTASVGQRTAEDGAEGRRLATASAVGVTLRRAFAWFGLIEISSRRGLGDIMRVTERGNTIASGGPLSSNTSGERIFEVTTDGEIRLTNPSPLQVWSIGAFSELVQLGEPAIYRLTTRSLERALAAGFQTTQVADFLRLQSAKPLPESLTVMLDQERRDHPVVRMRSSTLLTVAGQEARERLRTLLTGSGIDVIALPSGLIVPTDQATMARISAILRSAGFMPLDEETPARSTPQR
jgi:hypothetical protein